MMCCSTPYFSCLLSPSSNLNNATRGDDSTLQITAGDTNMLCVELVRGCSIVN